MGKEAVITEPTPTTVTPEFFMNGGYRGNQHEMQVPAYCDDSIDEIDYIFRRWTKMKNCKLEKLADYFSMDIMAVSRMLTIAIARKQRK